MATSRRAYPFPPFAANLLLLLQGGGTLPQRGKGEQIKFWRGEEVGVACKHDAEQGAAGAWRAENENGRLQSAVPLHGWVNLMGA